MADALLKKLRRLECNMTCPNCSTPASRGIGFGHVCEKYKSFICDMCKTSHQAISHRVKSISMSTWTMEEVQELLPERGGSNDSVRNTFLAEAPGVGERYPGGMRPKQGDKIEVFKQFVIDAYEHKKFFGNKSNSNLSLEAPSSSAPAPDLLGGGGPSSNGGSSSTPSFDAFGSSNSSNGGGGNAFQTFDAFGNTPRSASSSNADFDPFGQSNASSGGISASAPQPAAAAASHDFDAFGSSNASAPSGVTGFDAFGSSSRTGGGGGSGGFDAFASGSSSTVPSAMSVPPADPFSAMQGQSVFMGGAQQQQQHGGMGMGMGAPMQQQQAFAPSMGQHQSFGPSMGGGMGAMGNGGGMGVMGISSGMGGGFPQQQQPMQMQMQMQMQQPMFGNNMMPPQQGMGGGIGGGMMGGGGAQKTGMFSPGGAAVGGQGSGGGKPAMMQGKTMNSSRIGDIDLAASLASTINAKNGGGGGNGGGAPRGPYNPQQGADHFDFVKSSMGRR